MPPPTSDQERRRDVDKSFTLPKAIFGDAFVAHLVVTRQFLGDDVFFAGPEEAIRTEMPNESANSHAIFRCHRIPPEPISSELRYSSRVVRIDHLQFYLRFLPGEIERIQRVRVL
jgi:hypothetical protein